jgi:uncharacterized DUF497 family protein
MAKPASTSAEKQTDHYRPERIRIISVRRSRDEEVAIYES